MHRVGGLAMKRGRFFAGSRLPAGLAGRIIHGNEPVPAHVHDVRRVGRSLSCVKCSRPFDTAMLASPCTGTT